MFAPRHNPTVPENSPTSAGACRVCDASFEQIRAATEVILAGAANLRCYRDRLTPGEYFAIVSDIEEAAEQISRGLAPGAISAITTKRKGRRS
jgi:hypothetical protein